RLKRCLCRRRSTAQAVGSSSAAFVAVSRVSQIDDRDAGPADDQPWQAHDAGGDPGQGNRNTHPYDAQDEVAGIPAQGGTREVSADFWRSGLSQSRLYPLIDGLADPRDETVDDRLLVVRPEVLPSRQHGGNVVPRSVAR